MNRPQKIVPPWLEAAWRAIFPPRCLLCNELLASSELPAPPCCDRCRDSISPAGLYCPWCGCFYRGPGECCPGGNPLKSLFALSFYQGEWRKMLHRLKYRGQRQLSRPLGHWLGRALLETGWTLDRVAFIPMHPRKIAERGYNQSELLARRVAKVLGLPLVPALRKVKETPSQTGLSRRERHKNADGAFALLSPLPLSGTVLLVDDIYTTGATMKEAAAVLHLAGASVYGAVAAFQPFI